VSAVPFACDLHPEFGYLGSASRVFRRLRLVLSFVVLGVLGGASGVAVFMASPASDLGISANPLDAMALAPSGSLIEPKLALPEHPAKWICGQSLNRAHEGDCIRLDIGKVRPLRALNERPLIAGVPIGHRDDPATLALPSSAPVETSPSPAARPEQLGAIPAATETAVAEATPADAAPIVKPTPPAVAAKTPRAQVHHARNESRSGRRNNYSYASSYSAHASTYSARSSVSLQSGYARLW
jgi:hypothetical protein